MNKAEKIWRKIRKADKIGVLLTGMPFKNELPVSNNQPEQQKLAA